MWAIRFSNSQQFTKCKNNYLFVPSVAAYERGRESKKKGRRKSLLFTGGSQAVRVEKKQFLLRYFPSWGCCKHYPGANVSKICEERNKLIFDWLLPNGFEGWVHLLTVGSNPGSAVEVVSWEELLSRPSRACGGGNCLWKTGRGESGLPLAWSSFRRAAAWVGFDQHHRSDQKTLSQSTCILHEGVYVQDRSCTKLLGVTTYIWVHHDWLFKFRLTSVHHYRCDNVPTR